MRTKYVARGGLYLAVAFVLGYLETIFTVPLVPGMKIGLSNLVTMLCLYTAPVGFTLLVSTARVLLVSFTFGNMYSIFYSAAGMFCSLVVMCILKRTNCFSMMGVSLAGGVCHNFGQILVAMLVLSSSFPMYYFPVLVVSGTVAGIFIGFLAGMVLKRIPHSFIE